MRFKNAKIQVFIWAFFAGLSFVRGDEIDPIKNLTFEKSHVQDYLSALNQYRSQAEAVSVRAYTLLAELREELPKEVGTKLWSEVENCTGETWGGGFSSEGASYQKNWVECFSKVSLKAGDKNAQEKFKFMMQSLHAMTKFHQRMGEAALKCHEKEAFDHQNQKFQIHRCVGDTALLEMGSKILDKTGKAELARRDELRGKKTVLGSGGGSGSGAGTGAGSPPPPPPAKSGAQGGKVGGTEGGDYKGALGGHKSGSLKGNVEGKLGGSHETKSTVGKIGGDNKSNHATGVTEGGSDVPPPEGAKKLWVAPKPDPKLAEEQRLEAEAAKKFAELFPANKCDKDAKKANANDVNIPGCPPKNASPLNDALNKTVTQISDNDKRILLMRDVARFRVQQYAEAHLKSAARQQGIGTDQIIQIAKDLADSCDTKWSKTLKDDLLATAEPLISSPVSLETEKARREYVDAARKEALKLAQYDKVIKTMVADFPQIPEEMVEHYPPFLPCRTVVDALSKFDSAFAALGSRSECGSWRGTAFGGKLETCSVELEDIPDSKKEEARAAVFTDYTAADELLASWGAVKPKSARREDQECFYTRCEKKKAVLEAYALLRAESLSKFPELANETLPDGKEQGTVDGVSCTMKSHASYWRKRIPGGESKAAEWGTYLAGGAVYQSAKNTLDFLDKKKDPYANTCADNKPIYEHMNVNPDDEMAAELFNSHLQGGALKKGLEATKKRITEICKDPLAEGEAIFKDDASLNGILSCDSSPSESEKEQLKNPEKDVTGWTAIDVRRRKLCAAIKADPVLSCKLRSSVRDTREERVKQRGGVIAEVGMTGLDLQSCFNFAGGLVKGFARAAGGASLKSLAGESAKAVGDGVKGALNPLPSIKAVLKAGSNPGAAAHAVVHLVTGPGLMIKGVVDAVDASHQADKALADCTANTVSGEECITARKAAEEAWKGAIHYTVLGFTVGALEAPGRGGAHPQSHGTFGDFISHITKSPSEPHSAQDVPLFDDRLRKLYEDAKRDPSKRQKFEDAVVDRIGDTIGGGNDIKNAIRSVYTPDDFAALGKQESALIDARKVAEIKARAENLNAGRNSTTAEAPFVKASADWEVALEAKSGDVIEYRGRDGKPHTLSVLGFNETTGKINVDVVTRSEKGSLKRETHSYTAKEFDALVEPDSAKVGIAEKGGKGKYRTNAPIESDRARYGDLIEKARKRDSNFAVVYGKDASDHLKGTGNTSVYDYATHTLYLAEGTTFNTLAHELAHHKQWLIVDGLAKSGAAAPANLSAARRAAIELHKVVPGSDLAQRAFEIDSELRELDRQTKAGHASEIQFLKKSLLAHLHDAQVTQNSLAKTWTPQSKALVDENIRSLREQVEMATGTAPESGLAATLRGLKAGIMGRPDDVPDSRDAPTRPPGILRPVPVIEAHQELAASKSDAPPLSTEPDSGPAQKPAIRPPSLPDVEVSNPSIPKAPPVARVQETYQGDPKVRETYQKPVTEVIAKPIILGKELHFATDSEMKEALKKAGYPRADVDRLQRYELQQLIRNDVGLYRLHGNEPAALGVERYQEIRKVREGSAQYIVPVVPPKNFTTESPSALREVLKKAGYRAEVEKIVDGNKKLLVELIREDQNLIRDAEGSKKLVEFYRDQALENALEKQKEKGCP